MIAPVIQDEDNQVINIDKSLRQCDMLGWNLVDQLHFWFGDCDDSQGVITFTHRLNHGGFDIVAMFRPSEIDAAVEFVKGFKDTENLYLKTSLFDAAKIKVRRDQLNRKNPAKSNPIAGKKSEVKTIVGFAMDVDAGKSKPYADQETVWLALHDMPVPPSFVTLSGAEDCGFHAWWKLDRPIEVEGLEHYQSVRDKITAWKEMLCDRIAYRLNLQGITEFKRDKLVDATYSPDRVLRPVGAERKTGDFVKFAAYDRHRYSLDELTVPDYEPPKRSKVQTPRRRKEDSIIEQYFAMREREGNPITIDGLLLDHGYVPQDGGDWTRAGAESGSRSLSEGDTINGLVGVNVWSGNCDPLKCSDDQLDVGRRYSVVALWMALNFGDIDIEQNRKDAAAFCHNALQPPPEGAFEQIQDDSPEWLLVRSLRTENHLATRLVDRFGSDLRYVEQWKNWLVWDGKRFEIDSSGAGVLRLARELSKSLWNDLAQLGKGGASSESNLKAETAFCTAANKSSTIASVIRLATADKRVLIKADALNTNPNLLNLRNGTLDTKTGEFREHRRDDLMTQMADVDFDAAATCPQWSDTLDRVFAGDQELITYVQRIFGYSLFGDAGEAILPIAYGSGANGKSTIWNAIVAIAGDYGTLASESLLMGNKDKHETEKAQLYQKRIVAVSEPEQGSGFRESRVKELTGDATINCRKMYQDHWTFQRTHTFWLSTNHLPRIRGTDEGIWRRVKPIPFTVDLRKVKGLKVVPNFHDVLAKSEGPGILNWILAGFDDYTVNGMPDPVVVTDAIAEYRGTEDVIGQFVADCCEMRDDLSVGAEAVFLAYQRWGGKWTNTTFGKAFAERFKRGRNSAGAFYKGVGLR